MSDFKEHDAMLNAILRDIERVKKEKPEPLNGKEECLFNLGKEYHERRLKDDPASLLNELTNRAKEEKSIPYGEAVKGIIDVSSWIDRVKKPTNL